MKLAPVVLAGGKPGAFEKLTGNLPKTYLRIGGKALFQYAADALLSIFNKVYVVAPSPMEGLYTFIEEKGAGIEQALASADAYIGPETHILVAYGDVYVDPSAYRALVESAITAGADGAILAVPRKSAKGYGVVESRGGFLAKIGEGEGQWVFGGVLLIPREAARRIASIGLYEALNEGAWKIAVAPWGGVWHDVNFPEDVIQLLEYVAPTHTYIARDAKISPTAVIEGPVVIESKAEIDHYAVIKGPAYIGKEVFIGSHTLIRNFADIENGAVVGSAAEISHSLVGKNATIGRGSFVSYSIVGDNAVVEPNVITMSVLREGRERLEPIYVRGKQYYKLGALIPRGSRISSGTTLPPGHGWY